MQWGTKECDEYNKKMHKEMYDKKFKQYQELKKWLGIDGPDNIKK